MNHGEIKDNTATENGGGIYFDDSNRAYLLGGTISGNSAAKGGGFWINTTSPYTLVANSPYIYGNSTTGIAPNIYLGSKNTAFKSTIRMK